MSTYTSITKHPQTGEYEVAEWRDDYFGQHIYGVEFPSDGKIYPADLVERKQIHDFWKDDVLAAFLAYCNKHEYDFNKLELLNLIQAEYVKRWKRDPVGGEGAVAKSATLSHNRDEDGE